MRRLACIVATTLLFSLVPATGSAQVVSADDCASAPTFTGTNFDLDLDFSQATADPNPVSCGFSPEADLWFELIAPFDGVVGFGPQVGAIRRFAVYGRCSDLVELYCDSGASDSLLSVDAGDSLLIRATSLEIDPNISFKAAFFDNAVPANSSCATAAPLGNQPMSVSTGSAPLSPIDISCNLGGGRAVWFEITATIGGLLRIDQTTFGSGVLRLTAYPSCAVTDLGSEVACGTSLLLPVSAGDTFVLRAGGDSADVALQAEVSPPATNDDCAGALTISGPTFDVDRSGATPSGLPLSCGNPTFSPDVWFEYTPATDGVIAISVLDQISGATGALYTDCNAAIAGVEFGCRSISSNRVLLADVTAGAPVILRMFGSGTFDIEVVPNALNGDCASATPITDGTFVVENFGAPADGVLGICGGSANAPFRDVWFEYTPTCNGRLILSFDRDISVSFTSGFTSCAQVSAADRLFCSSGSASVEVMAGIPVLLRLANESFRGEVTLQCALAPPNNDCATATPITLGTTMASTVAASSSGAASPCDDPDNDVFFEYTSTCSGYLSFKAEQLSGGFPSLATYASCSNLAEQDSIRCTAGSDDIDFIPVEPGDVIIVRMSGSLADAEIELDCIQIGLNDECAGAEPIADGTSLLLLQTATASGLFTNCDLPTSKDVFYEYTPAATGAVQIRLRNATDESVISLYDDCSDLGFASVLACASETSVGTDPYIHLPVTAGDSLILRYSDPWRLTGQVTIESSASIPNDDCFSASPADPFTQFVDSRGATLANPEPTCADENRPEVDAWYSITADCDGSIEVRPSSSFDLTVYADCNGAASEIACETSGTIVIPALVGDTVLVQVREISWRSSYFTHRCVSEPVNDQCVNALPLSAGTIAVDYTGSTGDLDPSVCTSNSTDLHFEFVPSVSGGAIFEIVGGSAIELRSTCVDAQPFACEIPGRALAIPTTAGEPWIVTLRGPSFGLLDLEEFAIATNDTCATAAPIVSTGAFEVQTASANAEPGNDPPCASQGPYVDIWYDVTATCDGVLSIATSMPQDSGADDWILTLQSMCGGSVIECDEGTAVSATATTGDHFFVQLTLPEGTRDRTQLIVACSPPVAIGNTCATAGPISDGVTTLTNLGATLSGVPIDCGVQSGEFPDLWFEYTATCTGFLYFETNSSEIPTKVVTYDGCGPSANSLQCSNPSPFFSNPTGGAALPVLAGETLWFQVASPDFGVLSLEISCAMSVTPNDFCSLATPVSAGALAYDLSGAFPSRSPCPTISGVDAWFEYTMTADAALSIEQDLSVFGFVGAAVWRSCPPAGEAVACSEFAEGLPWGPFTAGETVLVQLISVDFFAPTGSVLISEVVPDLPNDTCGSAATLGVGEILVTNEGASGSTEFSTECGEFDATPADAYFELVPPFDGVAIISGVGVDFFDHELAVFESCTGDFVSCRDGSSTTLSVPVVAGQTRIVRYAGINSETGSTRLGLEYVAPANSADLCANAQPLALNGLPVPFSTAGATATALPGFCAGAGGDSSDVWFEFDMPTSGRVVVESPNPNRWSALAAYTSCLGAILDCSPSFSVPNRLVIDAPPGANIKLRVVSALGAQGDVLAFEPALAANSECNTSELLDAGAPALGFDFSTASASGVPFPCFGSGSPLDLWFETTTPTSGLLTLTATPDGSLNNDAYFHIFDSCGAPVGTCPIYAGSDTRSYSILLPAATTLFTRLIAFDEKVSGEIRALLTPVVGDKHVIVTAESPSGSIDSILAIEDALLANGVVASDIVRIDPYAFSADEAEGLGVPTAVWLPLGTYPANLAMQDVPNLDDRLRDLIFSGVPLFISGGDAWGFDGVGLLADIDGVDNDAVLDGNDFHQGMTGFDVLAGFDNNYLQERVGNDFIDELVPAVDDDLGPDTAVLLRDDLTGGAAMDFVTGIRYSTTLGPGQPFTGNVIATSTEFGGWYDGAAAGQALAMAELLAFLVRPSTAEFIRGDLDESGALDLVDAIALLGILGGTAPASCLDAADTNADGFIALADAIFLLQYLFDPNGPVIPAPFPNCDSTPSGPSMGCAAASAACP